MPLVVVNTSGEIQCEKKEFLDSLSIELSNLTGKPESYVMTVLNTNVSMTFGGSSLPCAFIEVKSIGSLNPSKMSASICKLIQEKTGIEGSRIYINFDDVRSSNWGFDGRTFG